MIFLYASLFFFGGFAAWLLVEFVSYKLKGYLR